VKARALAVSALTWLLVACGGSTQSGSLFKQNWQSDGGVSIGRVEERLRGSTRAKDANVAVGVTESGLVGQTLEDKQRWSYSGKVNSLPSVAGELVVFTGGDEVVALDAKTGKPVWKVDANGRTLRGAADDGKLTVVSLGSTVPGRSVLLAVDRDGKVVFEAEPGVEIGRPGVIDGVAFVPWGDQYVSVVDLSTKSEIGRLLMRDLVSHALKSGTELWFGERALVRFDEKIRMADDAAATRLALEPRELPGKPRFLPRGSELAEIDTTARAKIRLYATPSSEGGTPHFANQAYLATYFRVAYGLGVADGKLIWAKALPADALGGAVAKSGFVICDASGKVTLLDEKGGPVSELALGEKLRGCVVQASSLETGAGQTRAPLAEQLVGALQALEPNMAAAQSFLLAELGKLDDPIVTKALIDLASSEKIPPEQRVEARKLLATRRTGVEHMLTALERHYDFLSGTLPPPVGAIADALAALNDTRGAPLLARHLNDPANSIDDVERAARALGKLATPAEYRDLRTFFALYRATADEPGLVGAVGEVAGALLRVGGEEGRTLVERAASDPLTQPDVRRAISALLPVGKPEAHTAEAK
jgi:hypothetical protein